MNALRYELQTYDNHEYPLIFHYDRIIKGVNEISAHWHLNLELLFVKQGTLKVTLEDQTYFADEGSIVVINSNTVHALESESETCHYFCLILDYNYCDSLGFDTLNNQYYPLSYDDEMKNIFQLIINEGISAKQYYKKAIRALCHTMLILLHRNNLYHSQNATHSFINPDNVVIVKNIIDYIQENYAESFTLDDLARYSAISKFHMCRIFKEVTFVTINQFITQLRLEQAQMLLLDEHRSITEIALETGFKSLSYFTKIYKRYYGYPPSAAKFQKTQASSTIHHVNATSSVVKTQAADVMIERYV